MKTKEEIQKILNEYKLEYEFLLNKLGVPFCDAILYYPDYQETVELMREFNYAENHEEVNEVNEIETSLNINEKLVNYIESLNYLIKLYNYEKNREVQHELWSLIYKKMEHIDTIIKEIRENEENNE